MKKLSTKQYQAIQLVLEGRNWGQIAEALEIDYNTIYRWRQNPNFQHELIISLENVLNETSLLFSKYIQAGYSILYKIALNSASEYDSELQFRAACKLIELPFIAIEKLRILELYRREIELENKELELTAECI